MPRGKKRSEYEIKAENEAYLKKTRRWGNISGYPYVTVREAAYLLDVTPAEVLRRIRNREIKAWRVKGHLRGCRVIWLDDIKIVRYPPFEPERFTPGKDWGD
jgi:excisionase family DNA binding protein